MASSATTASSQTVAIGTPLSSLLLCVNGRELKKHFPDSWVLSNKSHPLDIPYFCPMQEESPRQKKIGTLLQQEVAQLLQAAVRQQGVANLIVSVTKVNVTIDLSLAKIYLSVFPSEKAEYYLNALKDNRYQLKHDLSQRLKNQLRRVPELSFFLDDSLDYIEAIEKDLTDPDNPIMPKPPTK